MISQMVLSLYGGLVVMKKTAHVTTGYILVHVHRIHLIIVCIILIIAQKRWLTTYCPLTFGHQHMCCVQIKHKPCAAEHRHTDSKHIRYK